MFTATSFVIAKNWKQLKHPSTDAWIYKLWCSHTMEYYSAIISSKLLIYTIVCINIKIIKLHEGNWTPPKSVYCIIPLI